MGGYSKYIIFTIVYNNIFNHVVIVLWIEWHWHWRFPSPGGAIPLDQAFLPASKNAGLIWRFQAPPYMVL